MKKSTIVIIVALLAMCVSGCATSNYSVGREFLYLSGKIALGDTKTEVRNVYGDPTSGWTRGELSSYNYDYSNTKLDPTRAYAQGLLLAGTFGLSSIFVDHGIRSSDFTQESRNLVFFFDLNDKVVDFYYHDSYGNGHDESEKCYLKAKKADESGDVQEAIKLARQAMEINQANHRALNLLVSCLIKTKIDRDKVVGLAERAVKLWPYSPAYWSTLGKAQLSVGNKTSAKVSMERAVDLYSTYEPENYIDIVRAKQELEQIEKFPSAKTTI